MISDSVLCPNMIPGISHFSWALFGLWCDRHKAPPARGLLEQQPTKKSWSMSKEEEKACAVLPAALWALRGSRHTESLHVNESSHVRAQRRVCSDSGSKVTFLTRVVKENHFSSNQLLARMLEQISIESEPS